MVGHSKGGANPAQMALLLLFICAFHNSFLVSTSNARKNGSESSPQRTAILPLPESARLIHVLIAVQATICFLVLFVAGLFVAFERWAHKSTGFSAERLLILDSVAQHPVAP